MRLIDADVLINRVVFHTDWSTDEKEAFEDEVNAEPAVDAVEVVRCKDCKLFKTASCAIKIDTEEEMYCGYAERRQDEID